MSNTGRIHYDRKTGRFRRDGKFVSRADALKSSVARAEYAKATAPRRRRKAPPPPRPKPKPKPAPVPRPRPKAPAAPAPGRIHYDKKTGRFRRDGQFVSRADALKSSVARAELAAIYKVKKPPKRKPPPPPKAPPKKKPRKRKKPAPPPVPEEQEVFTARGQWAVLNAADFGVRDLAKLILFQINQGAFTFRFWYKLPEGPSVDYPAGVGSTMPLHKSWITRNNKLSEVIDFVSGRTGHIKGKIDTYWYSFRVRAVDKHPKETAL